MTPLGSPLAGRRVVVTRPRAQAASLCALLRAEGAEVVEFPTIRIGPPADYAAVDAAIANLAAYAWIVFTSPNGVRALVERLRLLGREARTLAAARLAAIGPGTAEALAALGLDVELAPAEFRAEALVRAFDGRPLRGVRILIPRAAAARPVLPDGLRARGALVDVVAVYRTEAERGTAPDVRRRLLDEPVDAVTFTSSSTVRHFAALLGADAPRVLRRALVACIGPVTAETARGLGVRVGVVAGTYTPAGLVAALRAAFGGAGRPA